jgi:antibiotic biosynthesis monooxygenase (ABM) superfamily enzyme
MAKASAVVVQRVPPADADWFLDWQRGISAAAESFPGYRATDIYPPVHGQQEWVVVMHFDSDEAMQRWLGSPVRAEWIDKLRGKDAAFELKMLPGGFAPWFAGLGREGPPGWKMALTVLFGLYPTVMLLTIFVGPITSPLGLAVAMLIGNALSCSILQYGVMPVLTAVLAPWLRADPRRAAALEVGGLVLILVLLVAEAALFRLVTG